jgi:hypothetical protein
MPMTTLVNTLNQYNYRKIVPVLAVTETLHNAEETVWLPAWSQTAGIWHPPVGAFEFRFAVIAVTVIVYGAIFYFVKYDTRFARTIMSGAIVMVLVNVLVPHLVASLVLSECAPGVISGIVLNIPVSLYLLRRGVKEGLFSPKMMVFGAIGFTLIIGSLLPALFAVGAYVERLTD